MCFLIQGLANLKEILNEVKAQGDREEFNNFSRLRSGAPNKIKKMDEQGRVFPGYFSPILISSQKNMVVRPMRYRIRPAGSLDEIPSRFNVFNARRDSLLSRKTWRPLIGQNHGIFVMKKFYEWVERDGQKVLVGFEPTHSEKIFVPCLYDHFVDKVNNVSFYSFAVITDEPPSEVEAAGHDRCPIHLPKERIRDWLDTSSFEKFDYWNDILSIKDEEYFKCVEDYKIEKQTREPQSSQLKLF